MWRAVSRRADTHEEAVAALRAWRNGLQRVEENQVFADHIDAIRKRFPDGIAEAQRLLAEAQRLQTKLSEHVRQLLQQKEAADAPCSGGLPPPPPLGYRHFLAHS